MPGKALGLKLRCSSWEQLTAIYERDLRRSVFFLRSDRPPAVGTEMKIDLTLPSGTVVRLRGSVARHVAAGEQVGRGAGVELALTELPPDVLYMIESALEVTEGGVLPPKAGGIPSGGAVPVPLRTMTGPPPPPA